MVSGGTAYSPTIFRNLSLPSENVCFVLGACGSPSHGTPCMRVVSMRTGRWHVYGGCRIWTHQHNHSPLRAGQSQGCTRGRTSRLSVIACLFLPRTLTAFGLRREDNKGARAVLDEVKGRDSNPVPAKAERRLQHGVHETSLAVLWRPSVAQVSSTVRG